MSLELLELPGKDHSIFTPNYVFYWLLLPTIILWWSCWRLSRRHLYQLAKKLPGPQGLPVVGHLFDFVGPASCKWSQTNTNTHSHTHRLVNQLLRKKDVIRWTFITFQYVFIAVFKTIVEKSAEFPQLAKLWIGPKLVVFIYDPRDVEILLSSQIYIDKASEYKFFKPWLGDGLLISTGEFK